MQCFASFRLNWDSKIIGEFSEIFTNMGIEALISSFCGRLKHVWRSNRRIISKVTFDPHHVVLHHTSIHGLVKMASP